MSEALSCVLHSSIALHKDMEARPLSLEKCLDTFTAQEDIKEVMGESLCCCVRRGRFCIEVFIEPVGGIQLCCGRLVAPQLSRNPSPFLPQTPNFRGSWVAGKNQV